MTEPKDREFLEAHRHDERGVRGAEAERKYTDHALLRS
jgi:hypothetical protein